MSAASRPKRAVPSELPSLTLDMFPPGHSRVLTPRTDGTRTWCSVLGHKMERGAPMQVVVPVGYDERLYEELVRFGANNGVVATDVNELGRL